MSEFGAILDYGQVENAVRDVILAWIDTYLIAVERENDIAPRTITRPRSWKVLDLLELTPEQNLPAVYVISGGDEEDPRVEADRSETAQLSMGVIMVGKDTNRDSTRVLARRYGAALATLIDHKAYLAGVQLASTPRQLFDERANYSRGLNKPAFVMAEAHVTFTVTVPGIRVRGGGPGTPFPAPVPGVAPPANPVDAEHTSTHVTITAEGA